MTPDQLQRYSRQILLPQVGEAGQERLLASTVMVVGLGGLGSPVAMYLAAAGVGHLVLVDYDHVELSNLQRQIVHSSGDIGRLKVDSARETLSALNPQVGVTNVPHVLEGDELIAAIRDCDAVVDACDNFETRFALNRACVLTGTPLVSGAAMRMEGQVAVFQPALAGSPCYRCLYKEDGDPGETCSRVGVLAPLLGIIGSVQAAETLKLLIGIGETLTGRLLLLDAANMEWHSVRLRKDPQCPVCGGSVKREG